MRRFRPVHPTRTENRDGDRGFFPIYISRQTVYNFTRILQLPRLLCVYWTKDEGRRSSSFVLRPSSFEMLHIRLLGIPSIERDGQPLPPFKSRKVLALLTYLALNPGAHARSKLAGLLWSDSSEKKALDNLRFALWNLNEVLGTTVFEADRVAVAWQPSAQVSLDTDEFLDAIRATEPSHTAPTIDALAHAADLYRGDLLTGFDLPEDVLFNEWLQQQRAYLREMVLDALYRLAQHYTAHNQLPKAIAAIRRLLNFDPWREEAHRQMMLLLARSGQRTRAIAQYHTCQRILAEELGVMPAASTTALYERIRAAEANARHNLPALLTPFIGRTDELAELLGLLDNPECRLITLVGQGGVGKTRLALQAGMQRVEWYLNGVRFIPLNAIESVEHLVAAIAAQLPFDLRHGNPWEQVSDYLRTKEMLLILDNFEHLRANASLLVEILQRAPDVKILVTSRERLNLQSEWVLEVQGMPTEQAVHLFAQSARRVRAHFALDATNMPDVTRICQLVDGLPLAIELAAASVHEFSCAEIAHALEHNLNALTTTMADVPARHRSLHAVFEYSWNRLNDDEQRAFRQLAVFRGGFRESAAEPVAGASFPGLLGLVGKSLLRRDVAGRYAMLETVRVFALEKLSAEPAEEILIRDRHADYFADFLNQRVTAIRIGAQETLAQVAAEIENIRAGWRWACERHKLQPIARALDALAYFYEARAWFQEGDDLFKLALDTFAAIESETVGQLYAWRGLFAFRLSDFRRARESLQRALTIFRAHASSSGIAFTLNHLGNIADRQGKPAEAERYYTEGLEYARVAKDVWTSTSLLNNLGYAAHLKGEQHRARMLLEESLGLRQQLGDRLGTARVLINLAMVAGAQNEPHRERQLLEESCALFREVKNRLGEAICLNNLGYLAYRLKEYARAEELHLASLALRRDLGDHWGVVTSLDNLGAVACAQGELIKARTYFREGLTLAREIGATRKIIAILVGIATLEARQGNPEHAAELLGLALAQPAIDHETREQGKRLLAELETQLPREPFHTAVERGQGYQLHEAVESILHGSR